MPCANRLWDVRYYKMKVKWPDKHTNWLVLNSLYYEYKGNGIRSEPLSHNIKTRTDLEKILSLIGPTGNPGPPSPAPTMQTVEPPYI